ncbi:stage II sporulation protein M [Filimonas effusa]|uniref:Stage II sporulation protein M n=1 Tax=Filimonas effusa TaxID=2508721 RepID=A0A4Q1DBN3_9BACT|nr:stage II sporulation protein M [Filimonas effusa]RXK86338.1 stage II sporulation protein M [Filimonas effusa]
MREAQFIRKNKDRWQQMKENPSQHPDETAEEFIQLVEDLGYSKTFYPSSGIIKYLNTEAAKRYLHIYANQRQRTSRVSRFFKYDLPLVIGKHHVLLLVSFVTFLVFITIGFFSAAKDQGFVRQILGDGYVNMTERNIERGAPFGVYASGNEFLSFVYLFLNNIGVALRGFAGGILLGIPTILMLVHNGIMVGAFEYLFYSKGLMQDSLLTIMIHGTIELGMVVVAGAAGLVLAKSWLFPGTSRRVDALKQGAKEGLIIALANLPMLMIAAFFEGFVTRHADMSVWLKLLIIGCSLAIMIGYFVVYPIMLKKR